MTDRSADIALVRACIDGSKAAWAELVERHQRDVRFAIIRTLQRHGARSPDHLLEDLEAQLFYGLVANDMRKLRQYRGQASVKGWLKVAASHATIDHLRKRRNTRSIENDGPGDAPMELIDQTADLAEQVERKHLLGELREMWDQLPEADREFVEYFFVLELDFTEIARRTGATPGALYARKNRIRKKLIEMAESRGWFDESTRRFGS